MFLEAVLVFNCLVLYTTSVPILQETLSIKQTEMLLGIIPEINCTSKRIQVINFTYRDPHDLCSSHHDKFCQISKALNVSNCTEPKMEELRRLSDEIRGNATCPFPDNNEKSNMKAFLHHLKGYIKSYSTTCPSK